ncbi:MAG TPA: histidine--tRNA ligase [Candidatus Glassbacteria bacterium]|nr:histidine--tRNA ligase [Candidatus Glassbacteria bacterium]
MKYKVPRGTQDILPGAVEAWQSFEAVSRNMLERYGYREIRTPVFEQKDLFLRAVGQETDIVQKEMYTFADRKGREFALRPEGTAPVIRSYVENSLWQDRPFQKLYYIGPMFRYDRPQKGRFRQFHQVGAEAIGSLSPLVDAEVIATVDRLLRRAGITRLVLKLNSLGEAESRQAYSAALREYFSGLRGQLCTDCRIRLENNPLRILDCKVPSCGELAADIPPMEDYLSQAARGHYAEVLSWLERLGIAYEKDKHLVRGLDYYTRTTFEFHHGELGASVAVGGGGRYDRLVADCGGPDTPAIGFSLGTERVLLAVDADREQSGERPARQSATTVYLVWLGEKALPVAFKLADALRRLLPVEMDIEARSLKAQLRQADKLGASHALIIGEREVGARTVQVKHLATGDQKEVSFSALGDYVIRKVSGSRASGSADTGNTHGELAALLSAL